MKNIKILILAIILLIPSSLALTLEMQHSPQESPSILSTFLPSDLDIPMLFLLPPSTTFNSIKTHNHTYQAILSPKPQTTFYTTNQSRPYNNIDNNKDLTYTTPYTSNHYKIGNFELIRLFIPSTYYHSGYKYTTTSITIEITTSNSPKSLVSQKDLSIYTPLIENPSVLNDFDFEEGFQTTYDSQSGPNYIIITNESLWSTFNDNFRAWKIASDSKIHTIGIFNISDVVGPTFGYATEVNGTYGDAINDSNGNQWIADGEEIHSNYSMFNDTQARIRNFLRYCYLTFNTRYVLLGGNYQIVPTRYIATHASGDSCSTFDSDMNHSSDMYYSNLHKCQNNDTDQYWMSNPCCAMSYDDIDWGIDLYVGRVPVTNPQQLNFWINKTKAYTDNSKTSNYYSHGIDAARANDNSITDNTWYNRGGINTASLGNEFPSNITFVDNQNISASNWSLINDFCNGAISNWSGIALLLQSGHASINGGLFYTEYQPSTLNNTNTPNFVYGEGCFIGEFGTSTICGNQHWINDQNCTFASIGNSAYGWFGASTYFVEGMMKQMFHPFAGYNNLTFTHAHAAARAIQGYSAYDGVWAMIYKETNFFGDPALDWQWYQTPLEPQAETPPQFVHIDNNGNDSFIYNSTPTFNWSILTNTSTYCLQISNISTFASLVINLSNITIHNFPSHFSTNATNVSFILPAIYALPTFNIKYYCRVRALQRS